MRAAIEAENLGKAFRIGQKTERPETFVAAASGWLSAPLRNFRRLRSLDTGRTLGKSGQPGSAGAATDVFWALRDVSFAIAPGEVVGIIGRNGAGKSTLLKVLSRITEPTRGRAVIRGRVSSLLEVGTGFHPELTGRENIYMNGTILGMTKREIDKKFDQIVEFSGVETFLDTPTKRYSSGMQVRLAFAVAANLEPEILIIDEVLAVGDAEFQRKCLGKMEDVAKSGRTVLFVSHNMAAVQNLCSRGILLKDGQVVADDETSKVIEGYMQGFTGDGHRRDLTDESLVRMGTGEAKLVFAEIGSPGQSGSATAMGHDLRIRVKIVADSFVENLAVGFMIFDSCGTRVCGLHSGDTAQLSYSVAPDRPTLVECSATQVNLMPGNYRLNVFVQNNSSGQFIDHITHALSFDVIPQDIYETGRTPRGRGMIFLPVNWQELPPDEEQDAWSTGITSGSANEH